MAQNSIEEKDPSEIPEVEAFMDAKAMLESFSGQNASFIEQLRGFVEDYNQKREAAEKVVRGLGVNCGEFNLYQQLTKTEGAKVLSALGRELFIDIGGTMKTKNEAKIGVKHLKVALAKGVITQELFDEVTKKENRYHVPPVGALP